MGDWVPRFFLFMIWWVITKNRMLAVMWSILQLIRRASLPVAREMIMPTMAPAMILAMR